MRAQTDDAALAGGAGAPSSRPAVTAQHPSRMFLTRWLVSHTRRLVPILGISVLARIGDQLAGIALWVTAVYALQRAVAAGTQIRTGASSAPAELHLGVIVAVLVCIALLKAFLRYLEHYAGHWVAFTALQRLRELFFARLVPQAPAATTGRGAAELTGRATRDIDRIEVFFAHTFPPAVTAFVVPTIALLWLGGAVAWPLAGVLAVFTVAILLVSLGSGGSSWASARRIAAGRGRVTAHLGDDLGGLREALAYEADGARLAGLDSADAALVRQRARAGRSGAIRAGIIRLLELGQIVALVVCAALVPETSGEAAGGVAGSGSIGPLALALAVAIGLWAPTRGIADFVDGLDESFAAATRVYTVCEAAPAVRDSPSTVPQSSPGARPRGGAEAPGESADSGRTTTVSDHSPERATTPAVAFDRVTFRYAPEDPAALAGVSFTVAPGSWTYLLGVSGSGKSTSADLLLRGWDPQSGSVRLAGTDIRGLTLDELRRRVALVPQSPALVTGTLADNLRLGAPEAGDDELRLALRIADLDTWADGLEAGLDIPVKGRGRALSGGQLQRLALARALVAGPEVLVLDEALSQLDAAGAERVRAALRTAAGSGPSATAGPTGRFTVLEITHRTDLVPDAAPVVVLDAGRVLERGTAGALRAMPESAFNRLAARG
ncbi:ABC transporter ATP-binding protein/permease [Brevibacterium sp. 50QC2O2]|uniref:ABC transporter ATP-binding protein n=1 Tax=Brevibacterium sp. 50QC2O2 TaxID=2968459 RepID=UPI00211C8ECF|nr:ABC transporter ATP-binding protein [Brevibacterium sp. 50QC2O2]MCQ9389637.1 ABC transporter ATP-binding protein/permease [Brevibacterium sp. 50QC2O2]